MNWTEFVEALMRAASAYKEEPFELVLKRGERTYKWDGARFVGPAEREECPGSYAGRHYWRSAAGGTLVCDKCKAIG